MIVVYGVEDVVVCVEYVHREVCRIRPVMESHTDLERAVLGPYDRKTQPQHHRRVLDVGNTLLRPLLANGLSPAPYAFECMSTSDRVRMTHRHVTQRQGPSLGAHGFGVVD
jgi:hypothetical protein